MITPFLQSIQIAEKSAFGNICKKAKQQHIKSAVKTRTLILRELLLITSLFARYVNIQNFLTGGTRRYICASFIHSTTWLIIWWTQIYTQIKINLIVIPFTYSKFIFISSLKVAIPSSQYYVICFPLVTIDYHVNCGICSCSWVLVRCDPHTPFTLWGLKCKQFQLWHITIELKWSLDQCIKIHLYSSCPNSRL